MVQSCHKTILVFALECPFTLTGPYMALFFWIVRSRLVDYALTSLTVSLAVVIVAMHKLQTKLIYVPQFPAGSRKQVWRPSRFGFSLFEELFLQTSDGVKLHAYWIPCVAARPDSVPTILYLHANAGNMGHRLPIARRIADLVSVNILMLSYRGYGESEGEAEESGIQKDAQAALNHLLEERAQEIDVNRIVLFGQSLGGAVAIDLAARNQDKIAGLIVENTFRSLRTLVPHVMPWIGWARWLCHQRWESETRLREMLAGPLPATLFLSGGADELIPSSHMHHLFAIVAGTKEGRARAKLITFEKGTHNDTFLQPGYFEAISEFISSLS